MSNRINAVSLMLTTDCNASCGYCFATKEDMERTHGDLETLKHIAHNLIANGRIEEFTLVGGDPCAYPHLVEFLKYIKEEGKKYNVDTRTIVLSNTHDYKENGKLVDIKDVASYVDEMHVTIHGSTAKEHNAFNKCEGSYEHVMENLIKFAQIKKPEQKIWAIINMVPQTTSHLKEIMDSTIKKLKIMDSQDKKSKEVLNGFLMQRIAPSGRAAIFSAKWFLKKEWLNPIMEIFHKFSKKQAKRPENERITLQLMDAFPLCSINKKYWYLLPKDGCPCGKTMLDVDYNGNIKRCAMCSNNLSVNVLALNTPEKFNYFIKNDPELVAFHNESHLGSVCLKCENRSICHGACALARESGDPYKKDTSKDNPLDVKTFIMKHTSIIPQRGYDYLANQRN